MEKNEDEAVEVVAEDIVGALDSWRSALSKVRAGAGRIVSGLARRRLLALGSVWAGAWLVLQLGALSGLLHAPQEPLLLVLAVLLHLTGHAVRAEKMALLLSALHRSCRGPVYRCLAVGYVFNNALPLRGGELVRAHLLGRLLGISRTAAFLTIVFERLCDAEVLAAALLAAFVVSGAIGSLWGALASAAATGAAVWGLRLLSSPPPRLLRAVSRSTGVLNDRLRDQARHSIWSGIRFLKLVLGSNHLPAYAAMSALMWALYMAAAACAVAGAIGSGPVLSLLSAAAGAFAGTTSPAGTVGAGAFSSAFSAFVEGSRAMPGLAGAAGWLWAVLVVPTSCLGLLLALRPSMEPRAGAAAGMGGEGLLRPAGARVSADVGQFLSSYFEDSTLVQALDSMEERGDVRNIRLLAGGSHALTALVRAPRGIIVRKVSQLRHISKLEAQKDWIERRGGDPAFPIVLGWAIEDDVVTLDIEYRGDLETYFSYLHKAGTEKAAAALDRAFDSMERLVWRGAREVHRPEAVERYIKVKGFGKLDDAAAMDPALADFMAKRTISVNGVRCRSAAASLELILSDSRMMDELARHEEGEVHGDLTVDNLLVSDDSVLILDPNNENDIADRTIDYAKMCQSLRSGYEFLRDLRSVEIRGDEILFDERRSAQYEAMLSHLEARMEAELPPHRRRAVLFHEGIHYCRMLTYRVGIDSRTASAFYAVAARLFDAYIQKCGEDGKPLG